MYLQVPKRTTPAALSVLDTQTITVLGVQLEAAVCQICRARVYPKKFLQQHLLSHNDGARWMREIATGKARKAKSWELTW